MNALFRAEDRQAAEESLVRWSMESERLLFAALRLSRGDLPALDQAITLGQTDFRDLLVAADLADDIHAHEKWVPQPLTPALLAHWRSGGDIESVRFAAGAQVQVRRGLLVGGVGVVVTLEWIEPQPTYRIRFATGRQLAVRQVDLRESG